MSDYLLMVFTAIVVRDNEQALNTADMLQRRYGTLFMEELKAVVEVELNKRGKTLDEFKS